MSNDPSGHPYGFNRSTMKLLAIGGVILGVITVVWGIADHVAGRPEAVKMIVIGSAELLVLLVIIPAARRRGRL